MHSVGGNKPVNNKDTGRLSTSRPSSNIVLGGKNTTLISWYNSYDTMTTMGSAWGLLMTWCPFGARTSAEIMRGWGQLTHSRLSQRNVHKIFLPGQWIISYRLEQYHSCWWPGSYVARSSAVMYYYGTKTMSFCHEDEFQPYTNKIPQIDIFPYPFQVSI